LLAPVALDLGARRDVGLAEEAGGEAVFVG
jgi:hypothetical protein